MSSVRVEELTDRSGGSGADQVAHLRLWFGKTPAAEAARVLSELARHGSITLEFWDFRKPTSDRVHAANLKTEVIGTSTVVRNIPGGRLSEIFNTLASESFGAWIATGDAKLTRALGLKSNADRAAALSADGAFAVMSLYDENLELYARGSARDRLASLLKKKDQSP